MINTVLELELLQNVIAINFTQFRNLLAIRGSCFQLKVLLSKSQKSIQQNKNSVRLPDGENLRFLEKLSKTSKNIELVQL